ncbi:MAG: AarF/UbiB family protein, partial [Chitinophagales bacterium]
YLKHFAKKAVDRKLDREELDKQNAKDIFESLTELKGSVLKMAQMMSMDNSVLPKAFADQFALAQHSVPALSYPSVENIFKKQFGKSPFEIYDTFTKEAVNAASIGQVHQATLDGKKLAIKIQYPGVRDSIQSDIRMAKPFALKIMKVKEKDIAKYLEEITAKLNEETDYELELEQGEALRNDCESLEHIFFPKYYRDLSGPKILTMDWIEGITLDQFMQEEKDQEKRNHIGQQLWNFYNFQINKLKRFHADPHPGNFIINESGQIGVIDFGCIKELSDKHHRLFLRLMDLENSLEAEELQQWMLDMEITEEQDSTDDKAFYTEVFMGAQALISKPFRAGHFNFGDKAYLEELTEYGQRMAKNKRLRDSGKPRGTQHAMYLNRTYYGLFNILHRLNAEIDASFEIEPV